MGGTKVRLNPPKRECAIATAIKSNEAKPQREEHMLVGVKCVDKSITAPAVPAHNTLNHRR